MSDFVRVENELGHQYTTRNPGDGEKVLKEPAVDSMGNALPATYPEVKKASAKSS